MREIVLKDELLELFEVAPKESFELLLRNARIREILEELWTMHKMGVELKYDEKFETIFEEIFRFFNRPLEMAVMGARYMRYFFPFPEILSFVETQREFMDAYLEFIRSLYSHLSLTFSLYTGYRHPEPVKSVIDEFLERYEEMIRRHRITLIDYRIFSEYPFLLTKRAFENFEMALKSWDVLSDNFEKYKKLVKDTYVNAAKMFIETANSRQFYSYSDFANEFFNYEAEAFDELLKSRDYIDAQKNMLSGVMDYSYYLRKFFEECLECNPSNPFATTSQIDEAYKRIMDLRREVEELKMRIRELEKGEVRENDSGED